MSQDIEKRIERITNSLLPDTCFKNVYGDEVSLIDRMKHYHTPGVSIAVINNFKIEWAQGFGIREVGKPDPITTNTLFQAGSISKPVFALALMQLVQEGKLDLDEDVNEYLKSWKIPANGSWQPKVTLRQLLSHSAGLTVHGFPGYEVTDDIPSVIQILNGEHPSNTPAVQVNLIPGLQSRYSGGGTTVAQQLVVDLLSKPFPDIMNQLLFKPLGLTNSTYEQPLPLHLHESAATAHPWKGRPVNGKWHVYPEMAAAGLWTTPSDLARLGVELQLSLKNESKLPISVDTLLQMLTAQVEDHIGIGFFLEGKGETARFGHGGWDEGFVARMTLYKHLGFGAVIMINSNQDSPMISEIERAIAREYGWPEYFPAEKADVRLPHESLDEYVGEFLTASGLDVTVTKNDDFLYLQLKGQSPIKLSPESETKFFTEAANAEVSFEKNSEGKATALIIHQEGKKFTADRN
jgi:CubicO group peptidase (beta-lactamase class C family)